MNPQIPTLQTASRARVKGQGQVAIVRRAAPPGIAGTFNITVDVSFDPAVNEYPVLNVLRLERIQLTDGVLGTAVATGVCQFTSVGSAAPKGTPTVWISGKCNFDPSGPVAPPGVKGCVFWLLIANNRAGGLVPNPPVPSTPDVVSFVILERTGAVVAYGTGPLVQGDVEIVT